MNDIPSDLLARDVLEVFLFFDQDGDGLCGPADFDIVLLAEEGRRTEAVRIFLKHSHRYINI